MTLTSLGGVLGLASPLVRRVISLYRQESEKMVHGIEKALGDGDIDAAFRAAHSLKSSSMSIGARALSQLAAQLETLSKQGQLQQALECVLLLRAEHCQLMEELVFFEQKILTIEQR